MKANLNKEASSGFDTPKCPKCGLTARLEPPQREDGKNIIYTFVCPNGHIFEKTLPAK